MFARVRGLVSYVREAAVEALEVFMCARVGHDPNWTLGEACGFDRPVCDRCGVVL